MRTPRTECCGNCVYASEPFRVTRYGHVTHIKCTNPEAARRRRDESRAVRPRSERVCVDFVLREEKENAER